MLEQQVVGVIEVGRVLEKKQLHFSIPLDHMGGTWDV